MAILEHPSIAATEADTVHFARQSVLWWATNVVTLEYIIITVTPESSPVTESFIYGVEVIPGQSRVKKFRLMSLGEAQQTRHVFGDFENQVYM